MHECAVRLALTRCDYILVITDMKIAIIPSFANPGALAR